MPRECPAEAAVREALLLKGFNFVTEADPRAKRLDFYLVDFDLHIEVKRFHSDRIAEQMARADNVIAVQGLQAARLFARMVKGDM